MNKVSDRKVRDIVRAITPRKSKATPSGTKPLSMQRHADLEPSRQAMMNRQAINRQAMNCQAMNRQAIPVNAKVHEGLCPDVPREHPTQRLLSEARERVMTLCAPIKYMGVSGGDGADSTNIPS